MNTIIFQNLIYRVEVAEWNFNLTFEYNWSFVILNCYQEVC